MKFSKLGILPEGVTLKKDFGIAHSTGYDLSHALALMHESVSEGFPDANLVMSITADPVLNGKGVFATGQVVQVDGPGYE